MFWGLIMEPQRRYTQKVKKSFHISMASLDMSTSTDEPAQVMCGFEGRNYLLCTLRKPDLLQCALDLNFEVGDELSLAANGKCHVHLTGYLTEDFGEEGDEDDDNEVEEGDLEEEEEVEVEEKQKKKSKRNKKEVQNGPPAKKSKVADSDDEEESDTDIRAFLQKSLAETDEDDVTFSDDEAVDEEEDNDDDSEDLEDEEAESSLSEGDSDEKEVEEPPKQKSKKNKQNGLPVKQEKQEQATPKQKEKEKNKKKEQPEVRSPQKDQSPSKKKILSGGVVIEEIRDGQGPSAKPGKFVSVYYEGRLKHNNKVFDSTNKGSGFSFRLGSGEVIKGWDVGVQGMKVGGKRRITCPPSMAYGAKGSPPAIPANSILVFEVELKKVR